MRKLLSLLILLFLVAAGGWAQFYTSLPRDERRELAEAYYLVSRQYGQQGESQKAGEFEQMAYNIDPGLDPARIQVRDLPSAVSLILAGQARLAATPRERVEAVQELLKGKFLRLVSAFLSKDSLTMLELMDGSLYFGDLGVELSQAQIKEQLEGFFADTDLTGLVPSQVYDLNSLKVAPLASSAKAWGETYAIQIKARMDFSAQVAFWSTEQQYLMHHSQGRWLLFAVGQKLPPASWTPQAAPKASRAAAAESQAGPEQEIKKALLACLDAFLKKEVAAASRYFADQVEIIRLGTTLSREEIAATFQGYFEAADFSGLKGQDVLDADSIFVSSTERYERVQAYLLTVKTRLDLSDQIPFWTRFQDYYFSEENGAWRIFAIF